MKRWSNWNWEVNENCNLCKIIDNIHKNISKLVQLRLLQYVFIFRIEFFNHLRICFIMISITYNLCYLTVHTRINIERLLTRHEPFRTKLVLSKRWYLTPFRKLDHHLCIQLSNDHSLLQSSQLSSILERSLSFVKSNYT